MSVTCYRCGQTWPRDPALGIKCPQCLAPVGVLCRRPSGHPCDLHHSRDQAALDAGLLQRCPASMIEAEPPDSQPSLF